jgi:hypothetical protein
LSYGIAMTGTMSLTMVLAFVYMVRVFLFLSSASTVGPSAGAESPAVVTRMARSPFVWEADIDPVPLH